ncbi:MAG: aldo/keto reductase [Anditalea sp.]
MLLQPLGDTGIQVPPITFGTSALGNLYTALDPQVKQEIVKESFHHSQPLTVFDSAGKYGAGLALESLGNSFQQLGISPEKVVISNKLGWIRSPLVGKEPLFEPGVWKGLRYDAVQQISYRGILRCFEEGNELLQGFVPQLVSVHDPDEYLAQAKNPAEEEKLFDDILEAYRALGDLKKQGKVKGIGVGAKNWKVIPRIYEHIKLDWVMFANSMTIISHPVELLAFMKNLSAENVGIFNSAIFQSGFLVGGDHYDYKLIQPDTEENQKLFQWRDRFFEACMDFNFSPAHVCVQFALNVPGVTSVALSTTDPSKVKRNVEATQVKIPDEFWKELKSRGLLSENSPI